MALSSTEKKEIESMIRKEIKSYLKADTVKQFENTLIDMLSKEVKKLKVKNTLTQIISGVLITTLTVFSIMK